MRCNQFESAILLHSSLIITSNSFSKCSMTSSRDHSETIRFIKKFVLSLSRRTTLEIACACWYISSVSTSPLTLSTSATLCVTRLTSARKIRSARRTRNSTPAVRLRESKYQTVSDFLASRNRRATEIAVNLSTKSKRWVLSG